MTYSLVSAAALGFDLVRLPAGDRAADVLLRALGCDDHDLGVLADVHPGTRRESIWHDVRGCGDVRPAMHTTLAGARLDAGGDVEFSVDSDRGLATVLARLERSTVGTVDALGALVRHDVLDWTWSSFDTVSTQLVQTTRAADVLVDACVSGYAAEVLPDTLCRTLAGPYVTALPRLRPAAPDLGPGAPAVTAVLHRVSRMNPDDRTAWRAAVEVLRPAATGWGPAMHDASWAAYLSGRIRVAATAQLLAVQAFRAAGLDGRDGAYGLWNAVSGCVQAAVVRDLLPDEHIEELFTPWTAVWGAPPV